MHGQHAIMILKSTSLSLLLDAGVIITAVDSFLLLLIDRLGVRNLEAMFGVLVGVMAVAFGYMFADAGVNYGQVLEGRVMDNFGPNVMLNGNMHTVLAFC